MFKILLVVALGVIAGVVTGLIPGIHINLVSLLLLSSAHIFAGWFSLIQMGTFIISMSITHTFLDSIPCIFLGAPSSDTVLGVLPGHRYLLKGFGYMALKLTLVGSLGALVLSTALFPLFNLAVRYLYTFFDRFMGYFLIGVVLFMIIRDRKSWWALTVFLLSGLLGYLVLNFPGLENPLFPMLSGLFGISTLIISLRERHSYPEQKFESRIKLDSDRAWKALVSGQFSGFLTAMLPGLGSASAAVMSMEVVKNLRDHGYMILQGSINTVNFVLSLSTLFVIDKARNGSIVTIQKLVGGVSASDIMLFLAVGLTAGGVSVFLALWLGKFFSKMISVINYKLLVCSVIIFITALVFYLSGGLGMLILVTSTAVGIIPAEVKVLRTQAMGCIILPVITYFI